MLIDTHCHLTHGRLHDECDAVVARAITAGVTRMITIGTGIADGELGENLRQRHPQVLFRACGLDPFTCHQRFPQFAEDVLALERQIIATGCVAIGECGLEYFHKLLPKSQQIDCFQQQLALAQRLQLPVIIHVREAHEDMLAILRENPRVTGVIHSFDGTAEEARRYLDLGWYCSLNGMVTFKPKAYLREAAAMIPDDRLLIETDSPFLAPEPFRGQRCEPAMVSQVLNRLCEVRQADRHTLGNHTTANALRLFRFPQTVHQ